MLIIAPDQEAFIDIFSIFFNIKIYCVLIKQHISISTHEKSSIIFFKSAAMNFLLEGLKNEFKIAVVNAQSVFEQLKIYCICVHLKFVINDDFYLHNGCSFKLHLLVYDIRKNPCFTALKYKSHKTPSFMHDKSFMGFIPTQEAQLSFMRKKLHSSLCVLLCMKHYLL